MTSNLPVRPTLALRCQDGLWVLEANGRIVETLRGTPVQHRSKQLMQAMIDRLGDCHDLALVGSSLQTDGALDMLLAFAIHHDWVMVGRDDILLRFGDCLAHDPVLSTCPGPESSWQLPLYAPVWSVFAREIDGLRRLRDEVSHSRFDPSLSLHSMLEGAQDVITPIRGMYAGLSPERKTAVMALHGRHAGQVLAPIALALAKCTVSEYVDAVAASRCMLSGAFSDVRKADELQFRKIVRDEANIMLEYCRLASG